VIDLCTLFIYTAAFFVLEDVHLLARYGEHVHLLARYGEHAHLLARYGECDVKRRFESLTLCWRFGDYVN
jgi:hypothetical protein